MQKMKDNKKIPKQQVNTNKMNLATQKKYNNTQNSGKTYSQVAANISPKIKKVSVLITT